MPKTKAAPPYTDIVRNTAPWSGALYAATNPISNEQPTRTEAQS
jgi:hypothetical protein